MKTLKKSSPLCPKVRAFGLAMCLFIYVALSVFSEYELVHLTEVLTTPCLRYKIALVFAITMLVPIYLISIETSVFVHRVKLFMELIPVALLAGLYLISTQTVFSKSCLADITSIFLSDAVSSLILVLYAKLKHTK